MKKEMTEDTIDALYAAWSADRKTANPLPLRHWQETHPEEADELMRWTTAEQVCELSESVLVSPEAEARTIGIGMTVLREMRERYTVSPAPQPITSLIALIKQQGYTAKTLAQNLEVGQPLVAKLNQRLVRFSTIPNAFLTRLADALNVGITSLSDYLRQPPTLSTSAQYKADSAPQVADAEDFATAINACPDMTEAQKSAWLGALPTKE